MPLTGTSSMRHTRVHSDTGACAGCAGLLLVSTSILFAPFRPGS